MEWFLFGINTLNLAALGILQLLFIGRITGKTVKARHFAAYLALLYGVWAVTSLLAFHYADIPVNILILYVMGRLGLKNSRPTACVTSVLAVYIAQLSFGLVDSLTMLYFPAVFGKAPLQYLLVILAALLSLGLCSICCRVISLHITLQKTPHKYILWLLLPPGLFLFAVQLYILSVNYGNVVIIPGAAEQGKHFMLLFLQALGMGVLFSSLYAYRHTCDGIEAQAALASLEQEIRAQKTYVLQAQMRYENTRAFRHDMKNHLSVLDGYLREGNMAPAREYLKNLNAAAGALSFPVHTGNPTVDILLGEKLALAGMDGTVLEVSAALPQSCALTDLDWCVIFANALDNAIRACRQTGTPKFIRISGERQGDFYMLEFENTCPKEQPPVTDFGIGLGNIKSTAEKYGGAMTVEHEHGLFRLNVLLDISIQAEGISIQEA